MRAADYIVDVGPRGGRARRRDRRLRLRRGHYERAALHNGRFSGGQTQRSKSPSVRKQPDGRWFEVDGCRQNNLKGIDVKIPAGLMTAVTGVSGSGKSSLVNEIILPLLSNALNGSRLPAGKSGACRGLEYFDKVIAIDQSPIGRTPRSNPATYTGVFTAIRDLFAATPDAKAMGFKSGTVFLQRRGRPVRKLPGRRHHEDRNALPARRLRPLRSVRRQAL